MARWRLLEGYGQMGQSRNCRVVKFDSFYAKMPVTVGEVAERCIFAGSRKGRGRGKLHLCFVSYTHRRLLASHDQSSPPPFHKALVKLHPALLNFDHTPLDTGRSDV